MRRSIAIFLVIALAQLAVPAWMIVAHERVLREGEVFKFRTAPIDPRDPFRGEYVVLNFEASSGSWHNPHGTPDGSTDEIPYSEQHGYALLAVNDSTGYAMITGLAATPPSTGAYLSVTYWGRMGDLVDQVDLPFDRFYLEEGDGATTEEMLMPTWENGEMTQPLPAYASVRVYNGEAVIEDLIIDEKSIRLWLQEP